jgi:nucleotide-binding universal stress UspA family protein
MEFLVSLEIEPPDGTPADEVEDRRARELGVDTIVVGSQPRHGLARLRSGSVAEHVVRHAPCAVLVVRVDG